MEAHTKVEVDTIPKCDFCKAEARYDGKINLGAWGYMCLLCFGEHGIGLGLGRGQELIRRKPKEEGDR